MRCRWFNRFPAFGLGLSYAWLFAPEIQIAPWPLLLGHRGLCGSSAENSLAAFNSAVAAGLDGFELDVQPTADDVCCVLHDDDFLRTTGRPGKLRDTLAARLPNLRNGERIPRLEEALALPCRLVNVELKGTAGWQPALAAVRRAGALRRVLFSSFEHEEIHQLRKACPEARCGLLWDTAEAARLDAAALRGLPAGLTLHLPLCEVKARPDFWRPHQGRLVLWGMASPGEGKELGFRPAAMIVDGL